MPLSYSVVKILFTAKLQFRDEATTGEDDLGCKLGGEIAATGSCTQ